MTNNINKTLPATFKFTCPDEEIIYTFHRISLTDRCVIMWVDRNGVAQGCGGYSVENIAELIDSGLWTIVESKKELPATFQFKSVHSTEVYTATHDHEHNGYKITWGVHGGQMFAPMAGTVENISNGTWIVLKLPETFQFTCKDDHRTTPIVYTYKKLNNDTCMTSWGDGVTREQQLYDIEEVERYLSTGEWVLLTFENDACGETSNIPPAAVASIYDPISFLMGR